MFTALGMNGSAALCCGLMGVFAGVVTIAQQFWLGGRHR